MNSSDSEYYSIESALANPNKVKSLYLNYSFTEIKELPEELGNLINLEELTLYPRLFPFPKIEENKIVKNKLDDSELRSVDILPIELRNCKNLQKMEFTNSSLKELPPELNKFPNLEIIRISLSPIKLDNEMDNLLAIKNELTLEIFGCEISDKNLQKLRAKENLKIIAKREDYGTISANTKSEAIDLQLHDTYIVFPNRGELNKFLKSMPERMKNIARIIPKKNKN